MKTRQEKRALKELKHIEDVAEAFLKARSVYPPEYDGFLQIAGQKQVDLFNATMLICEQKASALGYSFDWHFDQCTLEWVYVLSPVLCPTGKRT